MLIKSLLWALFIVPWFSLLLTKQESIRRYLPLTILNQKRAWKIIKIKEIAK